MSFYSIIFMMVNRTKAKKVFYLLKGSLYSSEILVLPDELFC